MTNHLTFVCLFVCFFGNWSVIKIFSVSVFTLSSQTKYTMIVGSGCIFFVRLLGLNMRVATVTLWCCKFSNTEYLGRAVST